jgi:hypothetical protein
MEKLTFHLCRRASQAADVISKSYGELIHGNRLILSTVVPEVHMMGTGLASQSHTLDPSHQRGPVIVLGRAPMSKINASHGQLFDYLWILLYTIASLSFSIVAFYFLQYYSTLRV